VRTNGRSAADGDAPFAPQSAHSWLSASFINSATIFLLRSPSSTRFAMGKVCRGAGGAQQQLASPVSARAAGAAAKFPAPHPRRW
jgi:hypothetical protein